MIFNNSLTFNTESHSKVLAVQSGNGSKERSIRADRFMGDLAFNVGSKASGNDLKPGVNYFSNTGGAQTGKMPTDGQSKIGDAIRIKAAADCSATNTLTIVRGNGDTSTLFDGVNQVQLASPNAAVELVKVASNTWKIF